MSADLARILEISVGDYPAQLMVPYHLVGTDELSVGFAYEISFFALDPEIDSDTLLAKPVTIRIDNDSEPVIFYGLVGQARSDEELDNYGRRSCWISVVPWIEALQLGSDCRHYQNLSVPEIFQKLWRECTDAPYELKLRRQYPALNYVVQFEETHADFLNRLLQQAGIFYYHVHEDGQSKIVLCDDSYALPHYGAIEFDQAYSDEQHIHDWRHRWSRKVNTFIAGVSRLTNNV